MQQPITICIPTRNRRDLLAIALASVFAQTYRPLEILIGDDSDDPETADWIAALPLPAGITLRYERNDPPRGQAGNVNRLFDQAGSRFLLLLHDDDLLCPGGLDLLAETLAAEPAALCVYGAQLIVDAAGHPVDGASRAWNERYYRRAELRGVQKTSLVAALWQQVPNDGYLIDAALARQVRCLPESRIGQCIDADFIVRVALAAPADCFVYVDRPVSLYRLTPNSIARSPTLNRREDLLFAAVARLSGGEDVMAARDILLTRISVGAALDAAMAGRRADALAILRSRFYRLPLFSRWTLYRLACTIWPRVGRWTKHKIDGHLATTPADRAGG